jgi:restriction endonuclease S subunit
MTIKMTDDLTQMDYPRYDSYKDSGVDWLGEIPEGWDTRRLKYVLSERNERSKTGEEPLLMVSQKYGLVIRADYHDKATVALSNIDSKIVYKNDLVFNKLKAHLGVFYKSEIDLKGIVSPDYAVYRSKAYIEDLKFLELLFRLPLYIQQFIIRATGVAEGLIRLYTSELFDLPVPIPPLFEQKNILEFIDNKFVKIDQAIALKQQQIAKLEEYKQIVIQNAVTKGLNPDAPMKDSGVDWIGDIPEHWSITRIKNCLSPPVNGVWGEDPASDKKDNTVVLRVADFDRKNYTISDKNLTYRKISTNDFNSRKLVKGDLLIEKSGGGNKSLVGFVVIFDKNYPAVTSNFVASATPNTDFKSEFLLYFLSSLYALRRNYLSIKQTTGIQNLDISSYFNELICVPSYREQKSIIQFIELKLNKFKETTLSLESQIDRLKEYKTILINQAVTGKIKVS